MKLLLRKFYKFIPDIIFLKLLWYKTFGYKLNLKNPETYNEKLQWLKLYDRDPKYTKMVDKYTVRKYIAKKIGEEYLIPLIGVWDKVEEIDFNSLPCQFVLKTTHDSGGVIVCKDKDKLDINKARRFLKDHLKTNYYILNREWPYKNIKPQIICEKYMEDESGYELKDYKFFCFNGEPKFMYIATDRNTPNEETKFDFFDDEFNHLPFENGHPNSKKSLKKPECFDKMIDLAKKLSKNIPHVRVDFYEINKKIYFGELTFYHWSGMVPFKPKEWDYKLGQYIDLTLVSKKER